MIVLGTEAPFAPSQDTKRFFQARNVRVTRDELTYLHENLTDLVQVSNGDYPAVLGIFHHLHCLNNLRKIVHWDYYESQVELPDESLSKGHSGMLVHQDDLKSALN